MQSLHVQVFSRATLARAKGSRQRAVCSCNFCCSCISGKLHVQNLLYVQHSATRVMFLPISLTANMIVPPIVARKYCESTRTSRKRIDKVQRATIIALRNANLCVEEIATQTGSSRATIFRVLKSLKQPNVKHLKKMGRPSKTTEEIDKFIVDTVEENRKLVPKLVQKAVLAKYNVRISLTGIRFRLRLAGLYGRVCVRKPFLSTINKLKRLLWAFHHRHWSVAQWKKVLWSDEKKFELFNTKRRQHCRRREGEALRDDTIQPTVKHGGGSCMFWGCFGGPEVGNIYQVEGIMKKEQYHSILVRHAVPSGNRIFGGAWTFQQDNDPKHTSHICKDYLQKKALDGQFNVMEWPPQSPDLSPIELLWDEVDRQVQEKKPTSVESLVRLVKQTWTEISPVVLEKLLNRMPLICQAVIDAQGGYFDEKLSAQKKQLVYH